MTATKTTSKRDLTSTARRVSQRARRNGEPTRLSLLLDLQRDVYDETVAALGYDPLDVAR